MMKRAGFAPARLFFAVRINRTERTLHFFEIDPIVILGEAP
jgi:hypothetical protein